MNNILHWGVDIIERLQTFRTTELDQFFVAVTYLGSEYFYLLLLPLFFCLAERRAAIQLFFAFIASVWINIALKNFFAQPRPFDLVAALGVVPEHGYGLPSGHAQHAFLFWGFLALYTQRKILWLVGLAMVALISLSRVYLGVHFPTDIFAGWLLGASTLLAAFYLRQNFEALVDQIGKRGCALAALLVSVLLSLVESHKDGVAVCGLFAGFAVGLCVAPNDAQPCARRAFVTALLTVMGLFAIYLGLKSLSPSPDAASFIVARYLRYLLCGLWVGAFPSFFNSRQPALASARRLS